MRGRRLVRALLRSPAGSLAGSRSVLCAAACACGATRVLCVCWPCVCVFRARLRFAVHWAAPCVTACVCFAASLKKWGISVSSCGLLCMLLVCVVVGQDVSCRSRAGRHTHGNADSVHALRTASMLTAFHDPLLTLLPRITACFLTRLSCVCVCDSLTTFAFSPRAYAPPYPSQPHPP